MDARSAFVTPEERLRICDKLGVDASRVLLTIDEVRAWRARARTAGRTVGFVPTMGALHDGHLNLMRQAQKESDLAISSIFVNPAQFAPHEDFGKYPRTAEGDIELMLANGVDCVFVPSQAEMYPGSEFGQTSAAVTTTHVVPDGLDAVSEGAARPGFFRGVCTVVCKLLNIVQPSALFLGQKDGLQVIAVRRMVRDLNMPTAVRAVPTSRAVDGLALSSRNAYLSADQRAAAPVLYRALRAARGAYDRGERSYASLRSAAQQVLDSEPLFSTEYLSISDC